MHKWFIYPYNVNRTGNLSANTQMDKHADPQNMPKVSLTFSWSSGEKGVSLGVTSGVGVTI